jgi:ABC-2 type transport system permease protein
MTGLGPLLRKELTEQWRTRRLVVVGIVFLVLGIISPITAKYLPELIGAIGTGEITIEVPPPTINDAMAQIVRQVSQFGLLIAFLLAMGSMTGEKERGTAPFVLTKPVSRGAFLGAKAAALGVVLLIAMVMAGLGGYVYTVILFETPDPAAFVGMCALLLLQLVTIASVVLLASTVAPSTIAAGGIALGVIIVASIVSVVPAIGEYMPTALATVATLVGMGKPVDNLAGPVVVSLLVIAGSLAIAWLSFRRQEL